MAVVIIARLLIGLVAAVVFTAVATKNPWVLVSGGFAAVLFVSSCQGMAQSTNEAAQKGRSNRGR